MALLERNRPKTEGDWMICVGVLAVTFLLFGSIGHAKHELNAKMMPASGPQARKYLPKLFKRALNDESATETIKPNQLICQTDPNDECTLSCKGNVSSYALTEVLSARQFHCHLGINLVLFDCLLPDDSIELNLFSGNFFLYTLYIGCQLRQIAKGAFKQKSLTNLSQLKLNQVELPELGEHTLDGLYKLSVLALICRAEINICSGYLKSFSKTLTQLKILQQKGNKQSDPKTWLEGDVLENLTDLDFGFNYFPVISHEKTFANLNAVQKLQLNDCKIEQIGKNTFRPMAKTLQYVNLKRNYLKQLDVEFLQTINPHGLTLDLAFNAWQYACDITELSKSIKQNKFDLTIIPKFRAPGDFFNFQFKVPSVICKVTAFAEKTEKTKERHKTNSNKNCSDNKRAMKIETESTKLARLATHDFPTPQYPTPSTPSTPSTYPSTLLPPPLTMLECKNSESKNVQLQEQDANFKIQTLTESSIEITIEASEETFDLVFFADSHIHGFTRIQTSKVIKNLSQQKAYAFCLLPNQTISISPFNCRSHYLVISKKREFWLGNKEKAWFLPLAIFLSIFLAIVSAVAAYYTLRWRPILLRGNKRLVSLEPNSSKVVLYNESAKDFANNNQDNAVYRKSDSTSSVTSLDLEGCSTFALSQMTNLKNVCDAVDMNPSQLYEALM